MQNNPYSLYSCRFEFAHDSSDFILEAHHKGVQVIFNRLMPVGDGLGTIAEFHSKASLETLRDILRNGANLHVALQSLRPVSMDENSMERDSSIY